LQVKNVNNDASTAQCGKELNHHPGTKKLASGQSEGEQMEK
jgi:hypothetical protein